jgi:hypothetical protein
VIPVVNEIGSVNSPAARKAVADVEKRERDFEQQEIARIRGQGSAHFTPKKNNNNRPPRRQSIRNSNIDTTNRPTVPKNPGEITFKKTPQGPAPMRMWREY